MTESNEGSLSLLTDLYQLTMAQAYCSAGIAETEACFHLFFRANPFGGGFALSCGLASAIDYLEGLRFSAADVNYLSEQVGNDGQSLFTKEFLDYLHTLRFTCDVDAVP